MLRRASHPNATETARPSSAWRTRRRTGSVPEAVLDEGPERGEAVAPRDLLALVVTPPVVRHRQLVDAEAAAADLGRDLRLDAEVRLAQRLDAAQHVERERLVAGLHVGQRGVVEHVG